MQKLLFIVVSFCFVHMLQAQTFNTQGHRGARGNRPENTIPAMLYALHAGMQTLEMDVVISKDSQVVVSHDWWFSSTISTTPQGDTIERKDEKKHALYKMDYVDIRKYDVGMKVNHRFPQQLKIPAYKPLLAELIDSCEAYCKQHLLPLPKYNIEIKSKPEGDGKYHPAVAAFAELVMKVIRDKRVMKRVNIQSFDVRPLQYLHAKYPNLALAYLIEKQNTKGLQQDLQLLGFTPAIYSPEHVLVNEDMVKACHAAGMQIIPWTVNDVARIAILKSWGVDGIISDYPDLLATAASSK